MFFRKKIKTLETKINELDGRVKKLEGEKASNNVKNNDELDYKGVIDEWLNGKVDK